MYGITVKRHKTKKHGVTVRYNITICINRKFYYCGTYATPEAAQAARDGFLALTDAAEQTGDTSALDEYVKNCRKH